MNGKKISRRQILLYYRKADARIWKQAKARARAQHLPLSRLVAAVLDDYIRSSIQKEDLLAY